MVILKIKMFLFLKYIYLKKGLLIPKTKKKTLIPYYESIFIYYQVKKFFPWVCLNYKQNKGDVSRAANHNYKLNNHIKKQNKIRSPILIMLEYDIIFERKKENSFSINK